MSLSIGTIGYSHDDWKGSFYPAKISQKKMLAIYAERFSTVEVNFTFHALPTLQAVSGWTEQVPESFRFALKAWKEITHAKRLQDAEHETDAYIEVVSALGERQGPVLFQLPPSAGKDIRRLDAFLSHIAGRVQAVFEFRNASWFGDELSDCLRAHSAAQCITDNAECPQPDLVRTSGFSYTRLQSESYDDGQLRALLSRVAEPELDAYLMGNCFIHPNSLAVAESLF